VVLSLPLDSDKHFAAVEPPAEGPEDGEDAEALHQRIGGAFDEGVAEPGPADAADPAASSRPSGLTPSAIECQMGSGN